MSIRVMSLVWENFTAGGTEKLAMLALADWCNDEGGSLHPSISTIAKKINVSESQARRTVHKLIDDGYLEVIGNHEGGNPGHSRRYKISIKMLSTPSTHATPSVDATPSTHARRPLAPMRETPSTHASLSTSEPPSEPPVNPAPKKSARFDPMAIDLPDCIPEDAWGRWITYRRQRKLSTTEQTAFAQIEKLVAWRGKGHSPPKIIDESIANGWQGLFEPKGGGANNASTRESVIAAFTGSGQRQPAILEGYSERLVGSG